jgi:hypothetical protein
MFKSKKQLKTKSLFLLAAGMLVSLAAMALPHAGPGESYTFTFYSDASRTVEVGGRSYGYCGEPFQWGRMTSYSTYYKTTCNPLP